MGPDTLFRFADAPVESRTCRNTSAAAGAMLAVNGFSERLESPAELKTHLTGRTGEKYYALTQIARAQIPVPFPED